MRPRIQIALDLIALDDAIRIASKVADYVDFLEVGTPLIKTEGLRAVSLLKNEFSDKVLVADMKTMDTGYLEASLAFKSGADYSTVMALADEETIKGAIKAAREFGRGIMVDLMGVYNTRQIIGIDRLGPDYLIVHSGIDMQHKGVAPFKQVRELGDLDLKSRIGVAGGLNINNVVELRGSRVDLIIVGGYLTKASDPGESARKLRELVESIF